MAASPDQQAEGFLSTLFAPYADCAEGLTCEIREIRGRDEDRRIARTWWGITHPYIGMAARRAIGAAQDADVYVGVLPRAGCAGSSAAVPYGAWLWVDIDHSTPAAAKALLHTSGVPGPDIAVRSGGGVHCYWRVAPVCDVRGRTARARYEAVLRALAARIGGDSDGAHADPYCCDLARILRVPGTLNHKYSPPAVVEMRAVSCAYHSLEWWERALDAPRPDVAPPAPAAARRGREIVSGWVPDRIEVWAITPAPKGARHRDLAGMATWILSLRDKDWRLPVDTVRRLLYTKAAVSGGMPAEEVEQILSSAVRRFGG